MNTLRHMLPAGDRSASHRTVPWIREPSFGSTLGQRSAALTSGATLAIGPADLVHQGQRDGEKTSRFLGSSFSAHAESSAAKEDENQAGYFHFCNGIDYTQGAAALERYVLSAFGAGFATSEKGDFDAKSRWSGEMSARSAETPGDGSEMGSRTPDSISGGDRTPDTLPGSRRTSESFLGSAQRPAEAGGGRRRSGAYESGNFSDVADVRGRKQTIITVCAYNAFARSELRARFVVAKTRRGAVSLDPSYVVFSFASKRSHTYTRSSVHDIPAQFWTELAVSSLVRLFVSTDDASRRVCGTVLLNDMVVSHIDLRRAVSNVVCLLPKGHILGTRQSYGSNTSTGGDFVKTAKYRNFLVDTLVRLVALDESGKIAADTADAITREFGHEFDVAVCRVLKADLGRNHEARFLAIISDHVTAHDTSGQTALLLLEQARFLIGKKNYVAARTVASRAVSLLPLDYDAWYYLAFCYVMEGRYVQAMQSINSFPIIFSKKDLSDADHVDGIYDSFAMGFMERAVKGKVLDLRTFESFFPPPKAYDIGTFTSSVNREDGKIVREGKSEGIFWSEKKSEGKFGSEKKSEGRIGREKKSEGKIEGDPKELRKKDKYKSTPHDLGSIHKIWYDSFQYNPHLRHPIAGPFRQSPLSMATPMELSTVDSNILKISSPSSAKLLLAAQSASNPWSSIIDFDFRSTWGRTYDLVTSIIALIGWDELVYVKNEAFSQDKSGDGQKTNGEDGQKPNGEDGQKPNEDGLGHRPRRQDFVVSNNSSVSCKSWLQSLLLVIYEDLRVLIQTAKGEDQDRSALSWQMIGLLGWSCKFNLKDSISSVVTSVMGVSSHGGFDYFGTIKMLEMYGEFGGDGSPIDPFCEPYEARNWSNKLLIQKMSPKVYDGFRAGLMSGHFCMDNILLCLVKLISYNLRWYSYMPDYLTTSTLMRLCNQHDPLVVRSRLQILFKTHEKKVQKRAVGTFTLKAMFAAPKAGQQESYEFEQTDTILEYMDWMVSWIEGLSSDHNDHNDHSRG